jgi:hypothetical protein
VADPIDTLLLFSTHAGMMLVQEQSHPRNPQVKRPMMLLISSSSHSHPL